MDRKTDQRAVDPRGESGGHTERKRADRNTKTTGEKIGVLDRWFMAIDKPVVHRVIRILLRDLATTTVKLPRRVPALSVLATVVDVKGSGYRRPGARLLITEDGDQFGMISGGCLERDLVKHAFVSTDAGPVLVTYDTRGNRIDPAGPYNTGCDGVVSILLERLAPNDSLEFLSPTAPTPFAVVYRCDDPTQVGVHLDHRSLDRHRDALLDAIGPRPKSITMTRGGISFDLFVETICPTPALAIFGSG